MQHTHAWPASASNQAPTHDTGSGPYRLTTRTMITRDGGVSEFQCTHRFLTMAARDEFVGIARHHGLDVTEVRND